MPSDAETGRTRKDDTLADWRSRQFWNFLNSNLGLWFLSAVFVTAGGAIFNWIVAEYETRQMHLAAQVEADQKRDEAIGRLDLEIGFRFSQIQQRLYWL